MTELKIPFAVNIKDLNIFQLKKLEEKFLTVGDAWGDKASNVFEAFYYYGVDTDLDVVGSNDLSDYDQIECKRSNVHEYTYEQVMDSLPSASITDDLAVGDTKVLSEVQSVPESKPDITLGVKYDNDKPRWSLVPWSALKEIVDVLTYGSKKYADNNWKFVEPSRYKDAALRHFTSWLDGERYDPETGKSHLAHLGCSVLFLLWFELTGKLDD